MTLQRLLISLRYCLHRVGSELGLARNVGPRSERLIFVINCGESVSGWATRADRPTILFVFGMARSGTSALTRALSLLRRRVGERNAWRRQAQSARILGTAGIHFLSRTILQRHDSTWWKPDVLDVTSFDVRATLPRSAASRRTSQSCPPRQRWLSNTSCLWPSCGSRPARRRIPCRGCYCGTPSKSHRLRADCRHSA